MERRWQAGQRVDWGFWPISAAESTPAVVAEIRVAEPAGVGGSDRRRPPAVPLRLVQAVDEGRRKALNARLGQDIVVRARHDVHAQSTLGEIAPAETIGRPIVAGPPGVHQWRPTGGSVWIDSPAQTGEPGGRMSRRQVVGEKVSIGMRWTGPAFRWIPVFMVGLWSFGFSLGAPLVILAYLLLEIRDRPGRSVVLAVSTYLILDVVFRRMLGVYLWRGAIQIWLS
jgi:hypothetical protein